MTLFAPKRSRALGKARRRSSLDGQEINPTPDVNIQLVRENPEHLKSDQIINLQRTVGNTATQHLLRGGTFIQRMPTAQAVETRLGPPKKDTKNLFGKTRLQSTKYKAVLAALRAFEGYTVSTFLARDPSGLRDQMTRVNTLLQTVFDRMNAYHNKKGKKAVYLLAQRQEVKTFQNLAARAFLNKMDNPSTGHVYLGTSLITFLNNALRDGGQAPMRLDSDGQVGSERGGSKQVDKFGMGGEKLGYFSDQRNKISGIDPTSEAFLEIEAEIKAQVRREAEGTEMTEEEIQFLAFKRVNAKRNEFDLGVQALGLNPEDSRMNNRDIALSRLDQLLNTKLIARAQFAVVHLPDGSKREGTIMEEAKGFTPNAYKKESDKKGFTEKEDIIRNRKNDIGFNDPELMRQLSRLQLLDVLAFQIDRNPGNYYIQRDREGKLIGITGIDNDLSFGMNTDPDKKETELPGMSRYVDKELAQAIIALDPTLLETILGDLLPQREIQAAITRLKNLQAELQSDLTVLLEPEEWTAHAEDILNEKRSYYYNLNNKLVDTRS